MSCLYINIKRQFSFSQLSALYCALTCPQEFLHFAVLYFAVALVAAFSGEI